MITTIPPAIHDVWRSARLLKSVYGLACGLMQVTYHVFLYEHFGASPTALKMTVGIYMLMSLATVFLEIPTGALGDYLGRKKAIVLCFALEALVYFLRAWIYFIPAFGLSLFIAATAALLKAVSYSFYTGSITAWIVDSVNERGIDGGHGPILARVASASLAAKIIGAGIGVWCYLSGVVFIAFGLGSLAALLCAIYCGATMPETQSLQFHHGNPFVREARQRVREIMVVGWRVCIQHPPVRYMTVMFVGFMMIVHLVEILWPIALRSNFGIGQMTLYWYLITFGGMGAAYGGARLLLRILAGARMHPFTLGSPLRLWHWFGGICVVMSVSILVLGAFKLSGRLTPMIFLVAFVGFNVAFGFLMPAYETLLNVAVPTINARERATINSIGPMLVDVAIVIFALPSSGWSGETTVVGWMLPASFLLILTCIVHVALCRYFHQQVGDVSPQMVAVSSTFAEAAD
ncbi:MAG: MFS transporter [Deltaproteobacteria bacterium]|nr:MFS transporter [Deltaproteobacteria bacterium]